MLIIFEVVLATSSKATWVTKELNIFAQGPGLRLGCRNPEIQLVPCSRPRKIKVVFTVWTSV